MLMQGEWIAQVLIFVHVYLKLRLGHEKFSVVSLWSFRMVTHWGF